LEFNMALMNLIPLVVLVALICCTGVVVLIFFDLVRAKQGPKCSAPPSPLQAQYQAQHPDPLSPQHQSPDGAETSSGTSMAGSAEAGLQTGVLSSVALKLGVIKGAARSGTSKGGDGTTSKDAGAADRGGPVTEKDSLAGQERRALPAAPPPQPTQTENPDPTAPAAPPDLSGRMGAGGSSPQPTGRRDGTITPSSEAPSSKVPEGGAKNAEPSAQPEADTSIKTKSLTGSEIRSIVERKNAGNADTEEKRSRGSKAGVLGADNVMDLLGAAPRQEAPQTVRAEEDDSKKSSSVFVDIPEHLIASAEKSSESTPATLFMSSATDILQKADAAVVAKELPKYVGELKTSLITLRATLQRLKGPDEEETTPP